MCLPRPFLVCVCMFGLVWVSSRAQSPIAALSNLLWRGWGAGHRAPGEVGRAGRWQGTWFAGHAGGKAAPAPQILRKPYVRCNSVAIPFLLCQYVVNIVQCMSHRRLTPMRSPQGCRGVGGIKSPFGTGSGAAFSGYSAFPKLT